MKNPDDVRKLQALATEFDDLADAVEDAEFAASERPKV